MWTKEQLYTRTATMLCKGFEFVCVMVFNWGYDMNCIIDTGLLIINNILIKYSINYKDLPSSI